MTSQTLISWIPIPYTKTTFGGSTLEQGCCKPAIFGLSTPPYSCCGTRQPEFPPSSSSGFLDKFAHHGHRSCSVIEPLTKLESNLRLSDRSNCPDSGGFAPRPRFRGIVPLAGNRTLSPGLCLGLSSPTLSFDLDGRPLVNQNAALSFVL